MAAFFRSNGVRAVAVHSGSSSAPRHASLDELRHGDLDVVFAVDLFNEGLDAPLVDTMLMLRPTESPIVFLQQLGRGLRTAEGKAHLTVVDFIGNHRSFLLKPRTLLSLGHRTIPSTAAVIDALESGEFGLPPGCSVDYQLDVVEMMRRLAASSAREAIDEFCRSHFGEEGSRASATQTFHAGYNPASVRGRHGGWFGYLAHLGIVSDREGQVVAAVGDVLEGIESEQISNSDKLVLLRALVHDATIRTGAPVDQLSETSRALILGDPRLTRDVGGDEMRDVAAASPEEWMAFWRRRPIASWAGEVHGAAGRWFRVAGQNFEPTFRVPVDLGDTFDAMVAEIVEYRMSRYLTGQEVTGEESWVLKVSHADGRPLLFLNRDRNPGLPSDRAAFVADGREYVGSFMKVAMNVAEIPGQAGNALHALLRGWFGPSAGHPGTHHQVVVQKVGSGYAMRPVETSEGQGAEVIPLFASYEVACGAFEDKQWSEHAASSLSVRRDPTAAPMNPARQFACFARGNSMDGVSHPEFDGGLEGRDDVLAGRDAPRRWPDHESIRRSCSSEVFGSCWNRVARSRTWRRTSASVLRCCASVCGRPKPTMARGRICPPRRSVRRSRSCGARSMSCAERTRS